VTRPTHFLLTLSSALALFIIVLIADLLIGSVDIPISAVLEILLGGKSNPVWYDIIIQIRLPKALTAILAGAGLGLCGLLTQTFFRNPLAGPDVLGLSSGAGLAVAIMLLANVGFGNWTIAGAATVGAVSVFLIVVGVSKKISGNSSLLIIGLMIGALASSVVGILQFMSSADDLQKFMLWTMGNISSTNANELWIMLSFSIAGVLVSLTSIKSLNAWVLGERYGMTMGLNISAFRWKTLLATCLITGSITAFCGPISFVGIAVPHFVKRIFPTNNHQQLIPLTMIGGAILLLLCDILTLLPGNGTVLPINAATALFGAPVIIWIILRSKKEFY
jgi:iron complex transport system permease protein